MDCLEFRRLTLTDPSDSTPQRLAHRAECSRCDAYARSIEQQDDLIRQASKLDVPDGFAARILLNQSLHSQSRRPTRVYWLGLAASFLIGIGILLIPQGNDIELELISHANAHDVLGQGSHEHATKAMDIQQVLAASGTAMPADIDNVLYASTCVIEGETMAHLLVRNGDDKFVVYLIPQQSVVERPYQHAGWTIQTSRVGNRGIAVMNRSGQRLDQATEFFARQFNAPLGTGATI